jgi:signal transduction histidine kinase
VIRSHGGEVSIESRYGTGTTVTIVLPVDRPSSLPEDPIEPVSAAVEEHG